MLRKLRQIRFLTTKYLRVKKILILLVLTGTVDPTNSHLTLCAFATKNQTKNLYDSLRSFTLAMSFCFRFYVLLDCHDSYLNNRSGNILDFFYFFFHINLTFSFILLTNVFRGLLESILQRFFWCVFCQFKFTLGGVGSCYLPGTHSFRQDCSILCQKLIFKILAIFLHQKATNFDNFLIKVI